MKYYHALYVSDALMLEKEIIKHKIERNEWQLNKYLIVLTKNEQNHLEFFDAVLLLQKAVSKEDLFVVGIADGQQGALELIRRITEEVYAETKGADIRKYLLQKQQEYEERSE